jgi:hypothetical protein
VHRGASAKGPAGSGKTETIKDLGKGLGRYVMVVNCSAGMDYVSVSRMFSGMCETEQSKILVKDWEVMYVIVVICSEGTD